MENKNLKNILVAAGLAFAGVLTLGVTRLWAVDAQAKIQRCSFAFTEV